MRIIHVLRKPLSEGTVAANTLKHGTGGINIDASRVGAEERTYKGSGVSQMRYTDGRAGLTDGRGRDMEFSVSGRWPANVVLQHLDGCRCDGIKRVKGAAPQGRKGDWRGHGGSIGNTGLQAHAVAVGRTDEDGKETVANWVCEPGCPVARLDEQSGVLKSGALPSTQYTEGDRDNSSMFAGDGVFIHKGYKADTGGASRFYKQIGGEK